MVAKSKARGTVTIMEPLKPKATNGGKREGAGRPKGSLNKTTTELRNMITDALDGLGGVDYLMMQGAFNPPAFLNLVRSVLPSRVVGGDADENPIQVSEIKRTLVAPKKK